MGYRRQRRLIRLTFEDPQYEGLEVRARSVPLGKVLAFVDLAGAGGFTPEHKEQLNDLFALFASALEFWNLEDEDGQAVPTTLAGLLEQDTDFVMELVLAWLDGVVNVPAPLPGKSPGGELTLAASLPMELK
jgi:hypothetical protein